jgi:hypothetical protein
MACQTRVTPASRKQNKLKKTDLISVRAASALMTSARLSADEHGATAIEDFNGLIACYEVGISAPTVIFSTHWFVI